MKFELSKKQLYALGWIIVLSGFFVIVAVQNSVSTEIVSIIIIPTFAFIMINLLIQSYRAKKPKQYDINTELFSVDQLPGLSFELWCARLLKNLGFSKVQTTKASGDYGADIICFINGTKAVIQCKRYHNPVGIKPVREVLGARIHYNAKIMIVITNNYFTEAAIKLARESNVILGDRSELIHRMKRINSIYAKQNKSRS